MSNPKFYDSQYSNIREETYIQIRKETYGDDFGQISWITKDEWEQFFSFQEISSESKILEIACGSGGVSLLIAQRFKASVVGIDINEHAIKAANDKAMQEELTQLVKFKVNNAAKSLSFSNNTFDIIFCNDAINHLANRPDVLREWHRILRPDGLLIYTDPIIVSGILTNEEIAIRSSIGYYLFTPIGANEKLLEMTGFDVLQVDNVTKNVVDTSRREYEARKSRSEALIQFEGKKEFEKNQTFLKVVYELAHEERLSRYVFYAKKISSFSSVT